MVQGQQNLNDQMIITLDLELYPEPESQNLAWIIASPNTGEELELPPGSEDGRFKADFENLGNDKHQAILIIDPLFEEDVTKEIYFLPVYPKIKCYTSNCICFYQKYQNFL